MGKEVTMTIEKKELNIILNSLVQAKYNRENTDAARKMYEDLYEKLMDEYN